MTEIILIIVLVIAAMALIVAEICTPMFGLLGVVAVGCICWAVYICYTFNGIVGIIATIVAGLGLPAFLFVAAKVLPKTPLGGRLWLGRKKAAPGEGTPEAQELSQYVGREATTETVLRPSGTIRIDGKRVVAQAESAMIASGAKVKVLRATGMGVVVREVS